LAYSFWLILPFYLISVVDSFLSKTEPRFWFTTGSFCCSCGFHFPTVSGYIYHLVPLPRTCGVGDFFWLHSVVRTIKFETHDFSTVRRLRPFPHRFLCNKFLFAGLECSSTLCTYEYLSFFLRFVLLRSEKCTSILKCSVTFGDQGICNAT